MSTLQSFDFNYLENDEFYVMTPEQLDHLDYAADYVGILKNHEHGLKIKDHFIDSNQIYGQLSDRFMVEPGYNVQDSPYSYDYFVPDILYHFTRDYIGNPNIEKYPKWYPVLDKNGERIRVPVFAGSASHVNPLSNAKMQSIIDKGLAVTEEERIQSINKDTVSKPPLSPLHPFTRMDEVTSRHTSKIANLTTFNRFHIPIADLEHRKAFRQMFFTRPECYLMCSSTQLCQQAEYDEDFNSSYGRMPHIISMLSPVYVTGTFGRSGLQDNFNYLLSNRCMGLTVNGAQLNVNDTVTKSTTGYTVTPGAKYTGREGSTITVAFRDTKDLEVFEYIRMWMLYISKRKLGIFAPSFNGYQYMNGFPKLPTPVGEKGGNDGTIGLLPTPMHPYDRALDYTCSFFDIILDESGTCMKYWCKYYGLYPIDVQTEGLNNSSNEALTAEMIVNVTFKYHYKLENVNKSLIEFNFNAGVCNSLGETTEGGSRMLSVSQPFMERNVPSDGVLPYYLGAAGAFVGTPYVIYFTSDKDYFKKTNGRTWVPVLRFSPIKDDKNLDKRINLGIVNNDENNGVLARSDLSKLRSSYVAAQAAKENQDEISEEAMTRTQKVLGMVGEFMADNNKSLSYDSENGLTLDIDNVFKPVENIADTVFNAGDNVLGQGIDLVPQIVPTTLEFATNTTEYVYDTSKELFTQGVTTVLGEDAGEVAEKIQTTTEDMAKGGALKILNIW